MRVHKYFCVLVIYVTLSYLCCRPSLQAALEKSAFASYQQQQSVRKEEKSVDLLPTKAKTTNTRNHINTQPPPEHTGTLEWLRGEPERRFETSPRLLLGVLDLKLARAWLAPMGSRNDSRNSWFVLPFAVVVWWVLLLDGLGLIGGWDLWLWCGVGCARVCCMNSPN